jgi:hypothetical protein
MLFQTRYRRSEAKTVRMRKVPAQIGTVYGTIGVVTDRHRIVADPNPDPVVTSMRILIRLFTLMRIPVRTRDRTGIRLFTDTDPDLDLDPASHQSCAILQALHYEIPKLPAFDFDGDPGRAFDFDGNPDPDPAS